MDNQSPKPPQTIRPQLAEDISPKDLNDSDELWEQYLQNIEEHDTIPDLKCAFPIEGEDE